MTIAQPKAVVDKSQAFERTKVGVPAQRGYTSQGGVPAQGVLSLRVLRSSGRARTRGTQAFDGKVPCNRLLPS